MAETRREQRSTSGNGSTTQQVVDLLTSILTEARTQIRSRHRSPSKATRRKRGALFRESGNISGSTGLS